MLYFDKKQMSHFGGREDACQACPSGHPTDGFYFLPIVALSFIPFHSMCSGTLKYLEKFSQAKFTYGKHFNPKDSKKKNGLARLREFIEWATDWIDLPVQVENDIDAVTFSRYLHAVRGNAGISDIDKQIFFNILPLALTANVAPGGKRLDARPADTIDIEDWHDKGLGEYRGYFHFTPWVEIRRGKIVDAGVLGSSSPRIGLESVVQGPKEPFAGKTMYIHQPWDLAVPTSSSSVTPVPIAEDDWDDAALGHLLYLTKNRKLSGLDLLDQTSNAKHLLQRKVGAPALPKDRVLAVDFRKMRATGRFVGFDVAESRTDWKPYYVRDDKRARFDFRHGGRVGTSGQIAAINLNARMPPWICLGVDLTMDADGSGQLRIGHSLFPAHAVYVGVLDMCMPKPSVLYASTLDNVYKIVRQVRKGWQVVSIDRTVDHVKRFLTDEFGALKAPTRSPMFPKSTSSMPQAIAQPSQGDAFAGFGTMQTVTSARLAPFAFELLDPASEFKYPR